MPQPPDARRVWFSRRAIALHATVLVVVPLFVALFWWQVQRVRQGNTLSWAYVFEWPFFAGYALYLWWRLVHEQPIGQAPPAPASPPAQAAPVATAVTSDLSATGSLGPDRPPARRPEVAGAGARPGAEDKDEELAAYNRYLADLNATGRLKRW